MMTTVEQSPIDHLICKEPPHNLEAERSVLGGILLAPDRIVDIEGKLSASDFYHPAHRNIFAAMQSLHAQGKPQDLQLLSNELEKRGKLVEIGGIKALAALTDAVPTAAHAAYYAGIIREAAERRRLFAVSGDIAEKALDPGCENPSDYAERKIFEITSQCSTGEPTIIKKALKVTWERIEAAKSGQPLGMPTGFADLDKIIVGLLASTLVIVAGRPSMGKSTLAINIIRHVCDQLGKYAVLFSLEMGAKEICQNMLAAQARVDAQHLRTVDLSNDETSQLLAASEIINDWPLYIDDTAALSLSELRGRARRLHAKHGLGLIVVDYLQLLTVSGRSNQRTREQEVSEISRGLKALAKELQVPVIALSQLNRNLENRTDRRPQLSDLRESGAIEQDADVVMLLHRPEYYDSNDRPGEADVIVAKQRNGPTGHVSLTFIANQLRFENLAQGSQEYKERHEI